jgi:GT2 family glycosyltransferase
MSTMGPPDDASRPPRATLIISSRNRHAFVSEAVRSVVEGEQVPAELIVVDQSDVRHPDLDRFATARDCELRYFWTEERGLSRGRNMGIRNARHPILVFIDDDCRVTPTWFAAMTSVIVRAGERTVVTGRVIPGDAEVEDGFAPSVIDHEAPAEYSGRQWRDVLYPNNMGFFRSVIDAVGFFDERLGVGSHFPSSEDNDFCFRLLEAGYRIRYAPEAAVTHRAWRTSAAYLPLQWAYGRGQGAYYAKHLRRDDRYMLRRLAWEIGHQARRGVRGLFRDRRQAAGRLVFAAGVAAGAAEWIVSRPK